MRCKKNYYLIEGFVERLKENGRQSMLSFLSALPISVLRVLDTECNRVGRKPPEPIQLSAKSYPNHLVGKMTAQRNLDKDITSDSKVYSYFANRCSPTSQNRRAALRWPAIKLLGGGGLNKFALDKPSPLVPPWFIGQNNNKVITMLADHKQIGKRTTMKNQNRSKS